IGEALLHEAAITCASFSPDGRLLATGSDNKVRLWETATGRLIGKPLEHPNLVRDVVFSGSGKTLLTHCSKAEVARAGLEVRDPMARLWDVATGHPLTESMPHQAPTVGIGLGEDSGGGGIGDDPAIQLANRRIVRSVQALSQSFSSDHKFFVTY